MISDAASFGRIAAANALSDIYAMGGKPLYALNLVCFPQDLDKQLLRDILGGGAEKCAEAGALLAGGHSIYDSEIKYGLAITGIVDTDKFYRNNTLRAGDELILTKPLGVGIIAAAERQEKADAADAREVIASMERLNKYAAEKLAPYDISACTDITGFGLIVHALEMTAGKLTIVMDCDALPYFHRVKTYIDSGFITGAARRNRDFTGARADTGNLPTWLQELVFDPQTSGGLLIAVCADQAEALLREIRADDPGAAIIGKAMSLKDHEIEFK